MVSFINKGRRAYKSASSETQKALEDIFGKDKLTGDNVDLINSYEDVCELEGIDHKANLPYDESKELSADQRSENAYKKLITMIRYVNNGRIPNHQDRNERKYEPVFEYSSGVGFSYDDFDVWYADSFVGSRLCFFEVPVMQKFCKKFQNIYNDFLTQNVDINA